jgi:cysteine synthase A
MLKRNVLEVIGDTPLIKLDRIKEELGLSFNVYAKLERCNPSGSIKDRAAYYIIKEALANKEIDKNSVIVEATSGNTGISLSMICAYLGLKCIIFMPSSASKERRLMMVAYGSEVILTDAKLGMNGSVQEAKTYVKTHSNSFLAGQFDNKNNIKAHIETTSQEILKDLNNKVDVFISAFGTSGTLIGTALGLKKTLPDVEVIGVEPFSSSLVNKGIAGSHKIQGIGANFLPSLYNKNVVNRVLDVTDEDSYRCTRLLAQKEGLLCGISSGAEIASLLQLDSKKYRNKNIVIVLPDNGERYLSVGGLYE